MTSDHDHKIVCTYNSRDIVSSINVHVLLFHILNHVTQPLLLRGLGSFLTPEVDCLIMLNHEVELQ